MSLTGHLARAFTVNLSSINRRTNLFQGIWPTAAKLPQDQQFPPGVTRIVRDIQSAHQIETIELTIASNTLTSAHADGLPNATLPAREKPNGAHFEQIVKLERELSRLQTNQKNPEQSTGSELINMFLERGFLAKPIENEMIDKFIYGTQSQILTYFQMIVNAVTIEGKIAA